MITEYSLVSETKESRKVSIGNCLSSILPYVHCQQYSMWKREGETKAKPVFGEQIIAKSS